MTLAWYAVVSDVSGEERARMGLEALGVRVYLPRELVWRGRGPTKERRSRPLLSRYLFVAVPRGENRFEAIENVNGVVAILRPGPEQPHSEVPWRVIAIIQTIEGELADEFERKAARAKRKYGNDTDDFIERVKAAPPDERAEAILGMLGRGAKAKIKFDQLQELGRNACNFR